MCAFAASRSEKVESFSKKICWRPWLPGVRIPGRQAWGGSSTLDGQKMDDWDGRRCYCGYVDIMISTYPWPL
jgi:hypothetical protein